MSIYCVYLTTYKGSKLPPFYIGSTTVAKINAGYRGSVSSQKYRDTWKKELSEHPELFSTKIITTHESRKAALETEYNFQIATNAPSNSLYINEAYAKKGFAYGKKQSHEHVIKRTAHRKGQPGTRLGHTNSTEHKEKFTFKGRKHSESSNEANRIAHLGKVDTPETRQKRSDSAKGKPKPWLKEIVYVCPHCAKSICGTTNFNRWHNDNCKQRK